MNSKINMNEPSATALLVEDEPAIPPLSCAPRWKTRAGRFSNRPPMQRGLIDAGTRRPDLIVLDWDFPMVMASISSRHPQMVGRAHHRAVGAR